MAEHTPTPWAPDKYGQLRGSNGVPVNTKRLGLSQELGGSPSPEAEANAAFIVKCVNLHGELVAALRKARQMAEIAEEWSMSAFEIDGAMVQTYELLAQFAAILAKAES